MYQPDCVLPERGFWFRPTLFTGVSQSHRIAREEIFGPVLSILTFRTPAGGGGEGEQHAVRAVAPASGPRRGRASSGWPSGCAPASCGRTRSTGSIPSSPFGGYKESGFGREGGLHGLEPYLRAGADRRREHERAAPRPAHRQAVHRREVPAERVGPLVRGARARRPAARVRRAARRARTCATPSSRRAPRSPGGPRMTAYNRGQILYRVAELMEGRRAQFAAELARRRRGRPRARGRRRDRPVGLVRGLGRQGRTRRWAATNPVAGPYFNFTIPEPTGVVGVVAPQDQSLLGLVSRLAPAIVSGNTVVVIAQRARAAAGGLAREVLATSDVPGGVVNILTGQRARARAVARRPHGRERDRRDRGARRPARRRSSSLAAENVKRVHRAPDVDPFAAAAQSPYEITALMEFKTVWHPMGA